MAQPPEDRQSSRRQFLRQCGAASLVTGATGLRAMARPYATPRGLGESGQSDRAVRSFAPRPPHFQPRAKAVIHLFMAGGPSHLELFDPKPELARFEGKPLPPSILGDQRFAFIRPEAGVLGPQFEFAQYGESGAVLAEPLRHLASVADELCLIRSMHTDQFNHAPAQLLLTSGFGRPGRPSFGSWAVYGLGADTTELPPYVVMTTDSGLSGGTALWSSGFLPTSYTGVRLRNGKDPILDLTTPEQFAGEIQADTYALLNELNGQREHLVGDPEIAARMASFDMAARLQVSAPELLDLKSESQETLDLYGCDPEKPSYARSCLLARRLVERGVRFVSLLHQGWDAHTDIKGNTIHNCRKTDQAVAALITDLRRSGLLDETLVVWGGEFGRTPMVESNAALGRARGRDHHPQAFTMWMAGGGIRPGITYGATDDFGFHVIENPVHVHDVQATILHLLGLDHERLTFRHVGRDYRLTDVSGRVVTDLLA